MFLFHFCLAFARMPVFFTILFQGTICKMNFQLYPSLDGLGMSFSVQPMLSLCIYLPDPASANKGQERSYLLCYHSALSEQ